MLGFVGRMGWRIIDVVNEAGTGYLSLSLSHYGIYKVAFLSNVESAVSGFNT